MLGPICGMWFDLRGCSSQVEDEQYRMSNMLSLLVPRLRLRLQLQTFAIVTNPDPREDLQIDPLIFGSCRGSGKQ